MEEAGNQPSGCTDFAEPTQDHKRRRRANDVLNTAPGVTSNPAGGAFDASQLDWWQPQPYATLDPSVYQDRPTAPLVHALSCTLCRGLLKEAMTVPECGHTFCYDCIEARVDIGGNRNVCPAPGCGVVLGPNPFDHHKLVYDTLLDALVQKVFPRPELDAALTARRAEREEATRAARAAVNATNHHNHHNHQQQHQQDQRAGSIGTQGVSGRGRGRRGSGSGRVVVGGDGERGQEEQEEDSGQEGDGEGSDDDKPERLGTGRRGRGRQR